MKQLKKLEDLEKRKEGLVIKILYFNDVEIEKKHIAIQQMGDIFNATQHGLHVFISLVAFWSLLFCITPTKWWG